MHDAVSFNWNWIPFVVRSPGEISSNALSQIQCDMLSKNERSCANKEKMYLEMVHQGKVEWQGTSEDDNFL